jgi:hypothetical protein
MEAPHNTHNTHTLTDAAMDAATFTASLCLVRNFLVKATTNDFNRHELWILLLLLLVHALPPL